MKVDSPIVKPLILLLNLLFQLCVYINPIFPDLQNHDHFKRVGIKASSQLKRAPIMAHRHPQPPPTENFIFIYFMFQGVM